MIDPEDTVGGDDLLKGYGGDDNMLGGYGNDILYGDDGKDFLYGEFGDDKIFGGDGDDTIWGDDKAGPGEQRTPTAATIATTGHRGLMTGKDKLYGGAGNDMIYGGHLEDKIHGGEGDDLLYGEGGEDIIWGDEGKDKINAGYGWDTVFGGPGCDTVTVYDGGDVVWLGACDDEPPTNQDLFVYGTGRDPENWVVVMDFWLEGAKAWNRICPRPSKHQAGGPAAACPAGMPAPTFCVGATDIFSPGTAANTVNATMPGKV